MTILTVVYMLVLTTGNIGPTVRVTFDTWYQCEQARISMGRQTNFTGKCQPIVKQQRRSS